MREINTFKGQIPTKYGNIKGFNVSKTKIHAIAYCNRALAQFDVKMAQVPPNVVVLKIMRRFFPETVIALDETFTSLWIQRAYGPWTHAEARYIEDVADFIDGRRRGDYTGVMYPVANEDLQALSDVNWDAIRVQVAETLAMPDIGPKRPEYNVDSFLRPVKKKR